MFVCQCLRINIVSKKKGTKRHQNTSLPQSDNTNQSHVVSWAGYGKFGAGVVRLPNTCTIEDHLYAIHLPISKSPETAAELEGLRNKDHSYKLDRW